MKSISIILSIIIISGCAGWSRTDKALLTASWIAAAGDLITTNNTLNDGGEEMNPTMPNNIEGISFVVGLSQIAGTIGAHCFPKYRTQILLFMTGSHTLAAIHNSRE